jgi:hypothetical protein
METHWTPQGIRSPTIMTRRDLLKLAIAVPIAVPFAAQRPKFYVPKSGDYIIRFLPPYPYVVDWIPTNVSYHTYYGRRSDCPFCK